LVVARHSGSAWENVSRTANTGTASSGAYVAGTLTSDVFTALAIGSRFGLGSTSAAAIQNPLPVKLTSFTGERQLAGVRLRWATANEQNNNRFEVQRSADGRVFATLAAVAGQGTSATTYTYAYTDTQPLTAEVSYYRLRQVDTNGSSSFSPVVAVHTAANRATLFPNPAQRSLAIQTTAAGVNYCVRNALGQVVLTGKTEAPSTILHVQQLQPGAYYVEIQEQAGLLRSRFIKQ
jgi:hypothetical protein